MEFGNLVFDDAYMHTRRMGLRTGLLLPWPGGWGIRCDRQYVRDVGITDSILHTEKPRLLAGDHNLTQRSDRSYVCRLSRRAPLRERQIRWVQCGVSRSSIPVAMYLVHTGKKDSNVPGLVSLLFFSFSPFFWFDRSLQRPCYTYLIMKVHVPIYWVKGTRRGGSSLVE